MTRNQNVHTNSRQGYAQLIASGSINNLKTHIYKLLSENPPMTDKQIASRLGRLITSVRPRISDMVNTEHALVECGETKEDGKTVRVVRIRNDEDAAPVTKDAVRPALVTAITASIWDSLRSNNGEMNVPYDEIKTVVEAVGRLGFLK